MYCEFCYEENLQNHIESDVRPFDIYCSESCIESLIEEILNGEWDSHFDDNNKYKNELRKQFINKDKWFKENCTYYEKGKEKCIMN